MDEGTFWIVVLLAPFAVGILAMFAQIGVLAADVARQHRAGTPGTGAPLLALGVVVAVVVGLVITGAVTDPNHHDGTPWVAPTGQPAVSVPVAAPPVAGEVQP